VYVNYCHQCGHALSSAQTERCEKCAWLRCECGGCGCNYERPPFRPTLATVPPSWGAAVPHHVALPRAAGPRVPSHLLVVAAAATVLAAALAATASLLTPDVAIAPGPESTTTADLAPAASAPLPAEVAAAGSPDAAAAPGGSASAPADAAAARADAPAAPRTDLPAALYVANTDGEGAYLRSQPRDGTDTRIIAWREGTPLTPLETTTTTVGGTSSVWVRVRDPNGQTGWVRQNYLSPTR
jgi:hypothetical protein